MTPALLEPWLLATGTGVWLLVLVVLAACVFAALRRRAREDVAGRWVVVTGCDSGFGRGVVEALVARQAHVIAFCFTEDGAEAALAVGAARAPRLDLCDEQAVLAAAREVEAASGGRLWGLVHNAGVVLPGFVDYQPISFFRRVMDVNFFAPVLLTQKLLPSLRASGGRVVLVSSVDGLVSLPGNAPYDASKFAVEAYADALRAELSFWGVSVSVVNPSTMRTPMAMTFFEGHRQAWQEMDRQEPEGAWKQSYPADWLDSYIDFNGPQLERIAQDPGQAVGDIVHALSARRPRDRYLSGWLAKTLFYALWVGPESWANRFKAATIQPPPRSAAAPPRQGS